MIKWTAKLKTEK